MLFSDQYRFIFVHVQKTGGSSVTKALEDVIPDALRRPHGKLSGGMNKHIFAVNLQPKFYSSEWRGYFKFAFVRNPWSRLVSWYNMCRSRPGKNRFMRKSHWQIDSFEHFLTNVGGRSQRLLYEQVDYLLDARGRPLLDYVGRFERLNEDFAYICRRLGIAAELPHANPGPVVDYRAYYNDRTRQLVADRYRRDLDYFGYTFE